MAVIGGFRSDLSITRKTGGNFGNVSAGSRVSTKTVLRSSSERLQGRISKSPLRICFCLRRDENVLGQFLQKLSSQSAFKFGMILLDIQVGFAINAPAK